jgi:hypothetical protein
MAVTRKLPAAAGLASLALAALVVVSPSVAAYVPMDAVLELLGNDYVLLVVVAALALAAFRVVLAARTVAGVREATPPPVEGTSADAPGRVLDEAIDGLSPLRVTERHRRVHERVRTAAVETVAEADRCSRDAARERVESGEWTDDRRAATFLADETLDPPGFLQRVGGCLRREDWFRRRVGAAVSAIETVEVTSS